MAKKDEIKEPQATEAAAQEPVTPPAESNAPSATPNRDKWIAGLRGKYGEELSEDELYGKAMESYDADHEANKRFNEEARQFADISAKNPNLAALFTDILEGSLTDENYTENPELAEYAERKKNKDAAAASEEDKMREGELDLQAFEELCKEGGIDDIAGAVDKLVELNKVLEEKPTDFEQRKERLRSLFKIINYDAAVESAHIKGRNENIAEQRRNVPTPSAPHGGAGIQANTATGGGDIFSEIANSEKRQRDKNRAK